MAGKRGAKKDTVPWEPPLEISRDEIVKINETVLQMSDIKTKMNEDIFRMRILEMDWDIGVMVYEPEDDSKVPVGPDGRKVGVFLLHGGTGDYKSLDPVARMLTEKFGFKVASMTFPGRFYFLDPSRDWPGDTLSPDGTGRTPLWTRETRITPDQYEVVEDSSKRKKYGTIISLKAKDQTEFYYRMAAWPAAFEEATKETCRRHLPEAEYSAYAHGHSTGGPLVMMATQRVGNIAGVLGYGTCPFGYMYAATTGETWNFPFNYLRLRTWRDTARYLYEGLKDKGYGLPMMMELAFERWEQERKRPNFKAEDFVHKNNVKSLADAARVTARRLNIGPKETEALVRKYVGYCRELEGPEVKPVPPILFMHGVNDNTVSFHRCQKSLPMYAALKPAPKVRCVLLGAGVHSWTYTEEDLPQGIIPGVIKLWHDAIMGGFYT